MSLLSVQNLSLQIGQTQILSELSFDIASSARVGLIGESGSGKSLLLATIAGLLPTGSHTSGAIQFNGQDLLAQKDAALCKLRGRSIGYIFQEPMTALNPLHSVGQQIGEVVRLRNIIGRQALDLMVATALAQVGLRGMAARYPHELSGGQRQRVLIAMATLLKPELLLADEPTTALDSLAQKDILALMTQLARENETAMLLVTHDIAVAANTTDYIHILQAGRIVESGATADVLHAPKHPYTKALLEAAMFRLKSESKMQETPLLALRGISSHYETRSAFGGTRNQTTVLKCIDLDIRSGETLGLVGPSGCGKSTLAKIILGLVAPSAGTIEFAGERGKDMQIVFQDPYGSFDPRQRISKIVAEPLWRDSLSKAEALARVAHALRAVGLEEDLAGRFPHQLSGGQRQRVSLARAVIAEPELLILDEALSALDASVRTQILLLLEKLQRDRGLTYLFITHDLHLLKGFATRIAVMENGQIVEIQSGDLLFSAPKHPTTIALLNAGQQLEGA
jgi:peptide/nickel transport system ATP-binding protein